MSSPARALAPIATAAENSKKRTLAASDNEEPDAKRVKPQDSALENEVRRDNKEKKKRRKRKRKVSVVMSNVAPITEVLAAAAKPSGSRSRSRSMTLAGSRVTTPERKVQTSDAVGVSQPTAGPSVIAPRPPSPSHSSSSKGKERATIEDDADQATQRQQQITELQDQVSTKTNLVSQHENLLSTFQQSLSCQICLDLMHKPFALAPCGHSACYGCLVNWFKAPPPDVPAGNVLPVWLRKKTCPHCRALVRDRPIEIWTIKEMVASFVKSGLAQALTPAPAAENDAPANADPWAGIFRPLPRQGGVFPNDHPPELMHQIMGLRDDEDGGIYRCIDCHHEIVDGACSDCGRVYPGHDPLAHELDEFDEEDGFGHWGQPGLFDDDLDDDLDDDSEDGDEGDGAFMGLAHVNLLRRLFNLPLPGGGLGDEDADDGDARSEHSDHSEPAYGFDLGPVENHGHLGDGGEGEEDDEDGYESSFIDDGGEEEPRRQPLGRRGRADSVIDLTDDGEEEGGDVDDVQFVRWQRRDPGPPRGAIVIASDDEDDDGSYSEASADEGDAHRSGGDDDEEDLAAEVAAREYDMYGDDGSVPRGRHLRRAYYSDEDEAEDEDDMYIRHQPARYSDEDGGDDSQGEEDEYGY
ncbi:hypothetical protein C8Q77DRAFT_1109863 [Trametes polyzona]|nr:hypothetical protein C8Q77DRAFT_1109863 [Trametes polyzona]